MWKSLALWHNPGPNLSWNTWQVQGLFVEIPPWAEERAEKAGGPCSPWGRRDEGRQQQGMKHQEATLTCQVLRTCAGCARGRPRAERALRGHWVTTGTGKSRSLDRAICRRASVCSSMSRTHLETPWWNVAYIQLILDASSKDGWWGGVGWGNALLWGSLGWGTHHHGLSNLLSPDQAERMWSVPPNSVGLHLLTETVKWPHRPQAFSRPPGLHLS